MIQSDRARGILLHEILEDHSVPFHHAFRGYPAVEHSTAKPAATDFGVQVEGV